MESRPPKRAGSLHGIRVIDLTRILGGPFCTQILGDHGADVIKIEPPSGDDTRDWGPPFQDADTASYFVGINRNKRALALDLTLSQGRAVLLRLLEHADVLIHNFKSGTLERWGIGYEGVLAQRFPRLIYCHVTGFGADGPLGGLPGYDAVVQALSGLMSVNGSEASGPLRIGVPVVDLATGLHATIGILLALEDRHRSGHGQALEVSLYDSAISLLHPYSANYLLSGNTPHRHGNSHPNIVPYDSFKTRTTPIFLAVGNNRQFEILCVELDAPELAHQDRFRTNADRLKNRAELTAELERILATRDGAELANRLMRVGVPAGAVLNVAESLSAPHTQHRAMLVEDEGYRGTGIVAKMGRTPGSVRHPPSRFNQHGVEILEEAGYTPGQIAELEQAKVLAARRRPSRT